MRSDGPVAGALLSCRGRFANRRAHHDFEEFVVASKKPAEFWASFGATVRIEDAGEAPVAPRLGLPGGICNVVYGGERISNARFERETGWHPAHQAV